MNKKNKLKVYAIATAILLSGCSLDNAKVESNKIIVTNNEVTPTIKMFPITSDMKHITPIVTTEQTKPVNGGAISYSFPSYDNSIGTNNKVTPNIEMFPITSDIKHITPIVTTEQTRPVGGGAISYSLPSYDNSNIAAAEENLFMKKVK